MREEKQVLNLDEIIIVILTRKKQVLRFDEIIVVTRFVLVKMREKKRVLSLDEIIVVILARLAFGVEFPRHQIANGDFHDTAKSVDVRVAAMSQMNLGMKNTFV